MKSLQESILNSKETISSAEDSVEMRIKLINAGKSFSREYIRGKIQTDVLGNSLAVGDLVIWKPFGSAYMVCQIKSFEGKGLYMSATLDVYYNERDIRKESGIQLNQLVKLHNQ